MDYESAYIFLFRSVTHAINELEKSSPVSKDAEASLNILKTAQQNTEDMYISKQTEAH